MSLRRCSCGHFHPPPTENNGACECGCVAFTPFVMAVSYEDDEGKGYELTADESNAYLDYKQAARELFAATKAAKLAEAKFRQALDKLNRAIGAAEAGGVTTQR